MVYFDFNELREKIFGIPGFLKESISTSWIYSLMDETDIEEGSAYWNVGLIRDFRYDMPISTLIGFIAKYGISLPFIIVANILWPILTAVKIGILTAMIMVFLVGLLLHCVKLREIEKPA